VGRTLEMITAIFGLDIGGSFIPLSYKS
jgi:hypothetical protein